MGCGCGKKSFSRTGTTSGARIVSTSSTPQTQTVLAETSPYKKPEVPPHLKQASRTVV